MLLVRCGFMVGVLICGVGSELDNSSAVDRGGHDGCGARRLEQEDCRRCQGRDLGLEDYCERHDG